VTQSVKPSQEEIDSLHDAYVKELQTIWDTWQDEFAPNRQGELVIDE
jgi:hypothetical protein